MKIRSIYGGANAIPNRGVMRIGRFWCREITYRPLVSTLIAGTNTSGVGSWSQIWARDVAFLHFSQTASLGPHLLTSFWENVRPKGGGLGKMKKSDISGPNLPPGTNTRSVGSCDQLTSLITPTRCRGGAAFGSRSPQLGYSLGSSTSTRIVPVEGLETTPKSQVR